ncbi:MAG: hypothetical protein QOF82_2534 [Frankiales bacterium]|nr:hypothetical protein [Frankiales bacterium]
MRSSKSVRRGASARSRWRTAAATAVATSGLVLLAPTGALAASPVTPFVTCYWANTDGSYTLSVGYTNSGATTVTYPAGALNYVTPAPQDRGQPTVFLPGLHNNVWAPTISAADFAGGANWFVNSVPVNVSSFVPCMTKPVGVSGSSAGYLGATGAIVGAGALMLASPRRRRALKGTAKSPVMVAS